MWSLSDIIDNSASTRFFNPEVYDSNSINDVQQLLLDLESIRATGGGDRPEYGMNGIERVFDASTASDPLAPNHILLFTDAPPKDYNLNIQAKDKLIPPTTGITHTVLHGFLAEYLDRPCGTLTSEQCFLETGRAYADLIRDTDGILVSRLTEGGFAKFIEMYNAVYSESLPVVNCNRRRKRSIDRKIIVDSTVNNTVALCSVVYFKKVDNCKYETVSELARHLTLLVTPQSDLVNFTVTPPTAKCKHGKIARSATVTQVLSFDDPEPGRYAVCASEPFELEARIENNFLFSVEFFNHTSDTPYLLTLPPPGCPVNMTLFSPDIKKLNLKRVHHLELVSTNGSVIGRIPLINHGCSSAYIRGSSSLNLTNEAFNVRLSGISLRGYTFEAKLARQYTARFPPLQLRTTAAPTQIGRGETGVYSFHLTTTRTYSSCNLRLPISIEAQTLMEGVTLSTYTGGEITFSGSYTFSVRVTVSRDAPIRSGVMVLRIKDSKQKIILQSASRIGVGVSVVNVVSLQEVTT